MQSQSGYFELILGPMFSGKTSELQRRLRLAKIAGKNVCGFKYAKDNRYGEKMNTHDSISYNAENFTNFSEILQKSAGYDVIGVDEIQFALLLENFSSQEKYLKACNQAIKSIRELVSNGIRFIAAGLPANFRGEPFNDFMLSLMGFADTITSFDAICTYKFKENSEQCNNSATRTQRIINGQPASYDDPLTLIGAKESYEARCPAHHFVPRSSTAQLPL